MQAPSRLFRSAGVSAAVLFLSALAAAQWSTNPAQHLSVGDGPSDQILPKVATTFDGGTWVSWFDGIATGFDVRVQKLDAAGNEVFPHGGVLVADRSFTSVQDYGLAADSFGDALLAFRDDSTGSPQVAAARVSSDGTLAWKTVLTATTSFVASPKVAASSNDAVVAWTQGSEVRVQRLSAIGLAGGPPAVFTPPSGSYAVSDVRSEGFGDAIVSFVHQTGGFGSPRQLRAQKLDSNLNSLWGAGPVSVFTTGSLQFGNFPVFTTDGSGGALFAWYDTSGLQLQCYVQHLDSSGTAIFPAGGVPVSTNAVRQRVSPSAAFDAAAQETYVFWEETDSTQALSGLYGQKLDASGNRLWTDDGLAYVALSPTQISQVRTVRVGGATRVFWNSSPSFGQDVIAGLGVDGSGSVTLGPFGVSTTPSGKSRLDVAVVQASFAIQNPFAVMAWSDDRVDAGDVLAQNAGSDGTLGSAGITSYCTAKPSSAGCVAGISTSDPTRPPVSGANDYSVNAVQVQNFKNGLVLVGITGPASLPFSGGILCVNPPNKRGPAVNSGGFGLAPCDGVFGTVVNSGQIVPAGLDAGPGNSGWYQYWYRDPANGAGNLGTALSNALRLDFL